MHPCSKEDEDVSKYKASGGELHDRGVGLFEVTTIKGEVIG